MKMLQGDSTFVPVRAGENTDSDDAAPRAVRFNKVAEVIFTYVHILMYEEEALHPF